MPTKGIGTRTYPAKLSVYYDYFMAPDREIGLKRESGENPELPRSGKQERTLQEKHWFSR